MVMHGTTDFYSISLSTAETKSKTTIVVSDISLTHFSKYHLSRHKLMHKGYSGKWTGALWQLLAVPAPVLIYHTKLLRVMHAPSLHLNRRACNI
jgi:hypothetical protein